MQGKVRMHKAFIVPIILHCSCVWSFCGARSVDTLELVNKRVLRIVLDHAISSYKDLLKELNMTSLKDRRLQDMLTCSGL